MRWKYGHNPPHSARYVLDPKQAIFGQLKWPGIEFADHWQWKEKDVTVDFLQIVTKVGGEGAGGGQQNGSSPTQMCPR